MNVSIETAKFFRDQCTGDYMGHMANIPHNPVLHSLFVAHNADCDKAKFIEFLRACADALDVEEPF